MGVKGVNQGHGAIVPPTEQELIDEMDVKKNKYLRGGEANFEALKDKKLKGQLAFREELHLKTAQAAAKAEKYLRPSEDGYLEPEGLEKTWRTKQQDITPAVDILSTRNQYDIVVPDLGPYRLDFTPSGRYMMVGGRKGHLAIVDMKQMSLIKEFQVRETVRDVVFLHNETMFAAAQKKYPYIYNRNGTELHCLKEHGAALRLCYLGQHQLLASINDYGQLHYQDVTDGRMVGSYRTGFGRTDVMQVNRHNGLLSLGHSGGKVTMWSPTSSSAVIEMLCHKGPISAIAFHPTNRDLMATSGKEKKVKLWDMRNLKGPLQTLPGQAETLDFSQKGLLARGTGSFLQVLRDSSGSQKYERYMTHPLVKGYQIEKALFRPYEDVLCIGHSMGWSSILIPGSGEPHFDTWLANPFETRKQRKEVEVQRLLNKLPPETIMFDPTKIGTVIPPRREKPTKEEKEAELEAAVEAAKDIVPKKKTKGRSKPSKMKKKKQEVIASAKRPFVEQHMKEDEQVARKKQKAMEQVELPTSLQRFARKKPAT
ncbi:probable U3 small nucleolar RNA-associated protein 7 [Argentina anserina]|uniref:probable U3 small nucleolar RNA-associated protein 7 n=1 Tax=Argentina anserina TaxID=57926 RepID=UPI0021764088|nr:probable U3 small nucleolar RNA-associated protein 7 [Potentilla anserina]